MYICAVLDKSVWLREKESTLCSHSFCSVFTLPVLPFLLVPSTIYFLWRYFITACWMACYISVLCSVTILARGVGGWLPVVGSDQCERRAGRGISCDLMVRWSVCLICLFSTWWWVRLGGCSGGGDGVCWRRRRGRLEWEAAGSLFLLMWRGYLYIACLQLTWIATRRWWEILLMWPLFDTVGIRWWLSVVFYHWYIQWYLLFIVMMMWEMPALWEWKWPGIVLIQRGRAVVFYSVHCSTCWRYSDDGGCSGVSCPALSTVLYYVILPTILLYRLVPCHSEIPAPITPVIPIFYVLPVLPYDDMIHYSVTRGQYYMLCWCHLIPCGEVDIYILEVLFCWRGYDLYSSDGTIRWENYLLITVLEDEKYWLWWLWLFFWVFVILLFGDMMIWCWFDWSSVTWYEDLIFPRRRMIVIYFWYTTFWWRLLWYCLLLWDTMCSDTIWPITVSVLMIWWYLCVSCCVWWGRREDILLSRLQCIPRGGECVCL